METNEHMYPVCGEAAIEDIPAEVYWCKDCNIPIIQNINQVDKGICPICGGKTKYLTTDLRPVFPEERLLLEILLDKKPSSYAEKSVWCVNDDETINVLFNAVYTENEIREKIGERKMPFVIK